MDEMFINISKNKNASEIIQYLKKYTSDVFQKDASVTGLVFESHFLGLSFEAEEELRKIKIPKESYVFLLCISKGIQGNSIARAYQILEEQGVFVNYTEHIVLGEDLQAEASFVGEKKSREAEKTIEILAKELEKREEKQTNTQVSRMYSLFEKIVRFPKLYSFLSKSLDSNRCNKCGHCRGVCPTQKKIQKLG